MGRNLSPVLLKALTNLDKDGDSRKSAMEELKSCVKDLDLKTIHLSLAKVSETKESGSLSGDFIISLYEDAARVHGVKIVPMIDSIMGDIVQTLASSAGSFPLHQACSKVVPAIARYGIDPKTPKDKKRQIIHSLCKPLSDSLSSFQESLTSGAALCLKALVDSENWKFASDEMVNRVCQNVAVALELKSSQTNPHTGLVMALAKRNALIVEAYARLLIQSGLRMLNDGLLEGNSQKRLSAIQMVNFLMKFLDSRSIFSELELIIEEMGKCQSDKISYVKGAAFEALQTAKGIAIDKKPRYARSPSVTGSNFSGRDRDYEEEENISGNGDHSPKSVSPESRTVDFFPGYESVVESPISTNLDYERRSVNRKLWNNENGGVDVSLKDGLFAEARKESSLLDHSVSQEFPNGRGDSTKDFAGFMDRNPKHGISRSTILSPQRSSTQVTVDSTKIFKTPRKFIPFLEDPNDLNLDRSEKQIGRFSRSLSSCNLECEWSQTSNNNLNGFSDHVKYDCKMNESLRGGSESVSSTDDFPGDADMQITNNVVPENRGGTLTFRMAKAFQKTKFKLICGLSFVLLAMATPLLWINSQDECHYLVPT